MGSDEPSPDAILIQASIVWGIVLSAADPSRVREFLMESCKGLLDRDDSDRVAMASHELMENVLKYSDGAMSSFELTLSRRADAGHVFIRTRNGATSERRRDAETRIGSIGRAVDPATVYDELVATSPARSGSGLGLARIRAEADMTVRCVSDDLALTIIAEGRVSLRSGSC
jgi:two-component sensor histidine kinase